MLPPSLPATAQTLTVWDGGTTGLGTSWATNTNWVGDTLPPNATDSNVLVNNRNGTGTISGMTISGNRTLGLITFDNSLSRLAATLNVDTNGSGTTSRTLNLHTGITLAEMTTSVVFRGENGTLTVNLAAPVTFSTSAGSTLEFASAVQMTGTGRLTKSGPGTLTIIGGKDLDGGVTINEGRLRISSGLGLGLLPSSPVADRVILNGGTLEYSGGTDFNSGVNRGFAIGDNGGTISVTGAGVYQISAAVANVASQTGRLVKQGSGVLHLSSSLSTYSGGLEVLDGTLRFGFLAALGGYPSSVTFNHVIVNGGTLHYTGSGATSLVNRGFAVGSSGGTFLISNPDGFFAINGAVSNLPSQTGSLTKTGPGTLRLNGANAYTGATLVSEGTLLINGNHSAATGTVTVAPGATLGGSGVIGGATTILGVHSPGSSPGIQTFNAGLTYGNGFESPSIIWELFSNVAEDSTNPPNGVRGGTLGWDGVNVSGGDLNFLDPTTMSLVFNGTGSPSSEVLWSDALWTSNRQWLVYQVTGGGGIFNFANLSIFTGNWSTDWVDSAGNSLALYGGGASSFYLSQSGSQIFLNFNAIPEPGRALLLLAGGLAMLARRRRSAAGGSEANAA